MNEETPFVSFSNEELNQAPLASTEHDCHCGKSHKIEVEGCLGFYKCGKDYYLYSVNGKNITNHFGND
jgi:hypothetical protein